MISIRWTMPLIVLALASPVAAQETAPAPDSDKCRAQTDEAQKPSTGADDGTLSETLDDCNGVLKPPPTGDGEIAEPAPQQGETPIIKPDQLPPQQ